MSLTLRIFSRAPGRKKLIDERVLDEERITVGRGATCTVVLEDPNRHLSRLHAEFERTARGYLLRVMSGNAPVIVNGVSHFQGSELTVHAGDILSMLEYELEVVSVSVVKPTPASTTSAASSRPSAAAAPSQAPKRLSGPVHVNVQNPGPGKGRPSWLAFGAAAIAAAVVLALSWTAIRDGAEQKKAEQAIAGLEGEARSLLKLVDNDRREIKEATAAASREIERVEGLVRSTRSSLDRMALDAALDQARRMAKACIGLENKVRERLEGPSGLPKAEGTLGAAAAAARGGDRSDAIRLLQETRASLVQMRTRIAEDRKTTQAQLEKHREDLLAAESRAMAEAEARAQAEGEARAKAQARAEAEAAYIQTEQAAQSAHSVASPCFGRISGTWSHPTGGTWTFAGNQGTRVAAQSKFGSKARQITVMNVASCGNDTMVYKFARLALVDTDDPAQAYDRTDANTPNLSIWAKDSKLRYSISSTGLRIGNYTYAKQ